MENPIRMIIADDRRLIRGLFRTILQDSKNIKIVGEAANGPQIFNLVDERKPDILFLTMTLPSTDVLEIISVVKKKSPDTRILLFYESLNEMDVFNALNSGAKGFISLGASPANLLKAIQTVSEGELWVSRRQIARFIEIQAETVVEKENVIGSINEPLTQREKETLKCLTTGCSNKEIADTLFISEKTVKCHLNSIFKKLNVTRRIDATLYAINRGIT